MTMEQDLANKLFKWPVDEMSSRNPEVWEPYGTETARESSSALVAASQDALEQAFQHWARSTFEEHPATAVRLDRIERKLDEMMQKIARLAEQVEQTEGAQEQVVVLRSITHEEAKSEVISLFEAGEVMDYGDIVERLGIGLQTAVEICRELEEEGVLEEWQK